ncbi:sensor histidine kinase [Desulfuribacillus alkaliarsenatis]|uniref:histidine kinase n=1 Tax=Desulfuribacillus alkaliarsenatis TaxID=766136 RepID=A0A1E5G0W3_9FIRM|nr:ATP-binding protein [Desulfuribacillus alkaliarsenatis]OEF96533.1 hypothetical protein BHF68_07730 [Desulfuribacillus alkaliarsenatis]
MRTKLIAAFLLVTVLIVFVFSGAIYLSANMMFHQYLEAKHENLANQWAGFFSFYYKEYKSFDNIQDIFIDSMIIGSPEHNRMAMMQRGRGAGMGRMQSIAQEQLIVVDENKRIVYDSGGTELGQIIEEREYRKGAPIIVDQEQIGTVVIRDAVTTTVMTIEDQFASSMNRAIIYVAIFTLLFAGAIGFVLSTRMSKHLLQLREGVKRVSERNYQTRLAIDTKDEIGDLAESFNEMVDTIQKNEKIKNQLITDIAHELRTPITTLRGKLEMMQNSPKLVSQKEILVLHDEVLRLSKLINDLQEVSLLEDDRLPISNEIVNIHELLEHIASLFAWEADEKDITLKLQLNANKSQITGDRNRLIQVFINIITNGIRYLKNSDKTISIRTINQGEFLIVDVEDTGQGMSEQELEHVFQRFYRGDLSRARSSGGTGLGLAITKGIIEAHNGAITVASELGKGTTFTIKLPNCGK